MKKKIALFFAVSLLIISARVPMANAWDGWASGTILRIEITDGGNYGLRVYLTGTPALCSQGTDWAYLNDTDSNYKVYAAALLAAKISNSPVTLYTYNGNAGCHIGYMLLN